MTPQLDTGLAMRYNCRQPIRLSSICQRDEIPFDLCVDHIAFSNIRLAQVHKETKSYSVLSIVYRIMHSRSSAAHRQEPRTTHRYFDTTDDPTSDNGLLLKGSRIVTPPDFRESFLHELHKEQIDITKCQLLARSLIY